jgi:hypothetical protein
MSIFVIFLVYAIGVAAILFSGERQARYAEIKSHHKTRESLWASHSAIRTANEHIRTLDRELSGLAEDWTSSFALVSSPVARVDYEDMRRVYTISLRESSPAFVRVAEERRVDAARYPEFMKYVKEELRHIWSRNADKVLSQIVDLK